MIDTKFLSSIPIFSSLTEPELAELASQFTVHIKQENDIIFKKGDAGHSIYFIQDGSVKINIHALNNENLTLTSLHKGDFFGELTLFDNVKRTADAIAYTQTTLLKMSRTAFINFLKLRPDVAIAMLGVLGKRIRETNLLMETQTARNANEELENKLSFGDKVADKFAAFIGSWTFIICFLLGMTAWITLNLYEIFFKAADPYPFILLNLILSCLAAIQAPVIMMSQGRQSTKDHIAADLDYKINLKAELEIQQIRQQLDKINKVALKNHTDMHRIKDDITQKINELHYLLSQTHHQHITNNPDDAGKC